MNECWLWAGSVTSEGYGIYSDKIAGKWKTQYAHRLLYENSKGEIPHGLQIDHLCRVTSCVNPDHLEAVKPRVNLLRGNTLQAKNARKTHCKRGHEFDKQNTIVTKQGRACRTCNRNSVKEWRKKNGYNSYMRKYMQVYRASN